MLGAIVGDIVGSIYEFENHRSKEFPLFKNSSRFTDDSVLTCATAVAILDGGDYSDLYRKLGLQYPGAGYGARFMQWLMDHSMGPYDSYGNGSAMRVSPVGWAFDSEEEVLNAAKSSAEVTHNHPEGIKGAQATALAIFRARNGQTQEGIAIEMAERFGYDISVPVDELRHTYKYNESCQGTVPEAIRCYMEASDFEDAIRNAISIGGDSDTLAAITGSIAEATFGVPNEISEEAISRLDEPLVVILVRFCEKYLSAQ
jgi:ADP-ribosylglycohydrolase